MIAERRCSPIARSYSSQSGCSIPAAVRNTSRSINRSSSPSVLPAEKTRAAPCSPMYADQSSRATSNEHCGFRRKLCSFARSSVVVNATPSR